MAKAMSVILGLVFLAMGILGMTNTIPTFATYPSVVSTGEIILGGFGVLVGVFSRN